MSERISVLEDALHIHCGDSHPLLEPSLVLERVKHLSSLKRDQETPAIIEDEATEQLGATVIMKGDQLSYIGSSNTEVSGYFTLSSVSISYLIV